MSSPRPLLARRPPASDWIELSHRLVNPTALDEHAYQSGPLRAISTMAILDLPGDPPATGPTWHVSFSYDGNRPTDKQLRRGLRAFGMERAEEDNHHPGKARHFFLPVDPDRRGLCECKANEETITNPDGTTWTNPRDGVCRGCEFARLLGDPCPVHHAPGAPEAT